MAGHSETPATLHETLDDAAQWLCDHQSQGGGWGERQGDDRSALNTAEALLALHRAGPRNPATKHAINRAATFLEGAQLRSGPDAGAWPRICDGVPCPDLVRTATAIEALTEAGSQLPDAARRGVAWMLSISNEEPAPAGGKVSQRAWGYRRESASKVLPTCSVLSALLAVAETGELDVEAAIAEALGFLCDRRLDHAGGVGDGELQGVQTAYTAMCLGRAKRHGVAVPWGTFDKRLDGALEWLERNKSEAVKEVEVVVEIDPDRSKPEADRADYPFVFMTEVLVVRALAGSGDERHSEGALVREALDRLWQGVAPDGGFYGRRTFSWSTARAMLALDVAKDSFTHFPRTPRATSPQLVGHVILAFSALTLVAIVVLSALGAFGVVQAGAFVALALVALVGYDKISEGAFVQSLAAVTPGWKRSSTRDDAG